MKEKAIEGTVIKVTEKYIVLLTNDGKFKNIPRDSNQFPIIGQHFIYSLKPKKLNWKNFTLIAAALFMFVIFSNMTITSVNKSPAYILVIDINPSIEIILSEGLEVISSRGINNEGQEIVNSLNESHLVSHLVEIIERLSEKGYLDNENLVISTSIIHLNEKNEDIVERVFSLMETNMKRLNKTVEIQIEIDSNKRYEEAKELGISVNYYRIYRNLKDMGVIEDIKETIGKGIYELRLLEKESTERRNSNFNSRDRNVVRDQLDNRIPINPSMPKNEISNNVDQLIKESAGDRIRNNILDEIQERTIRQDRARENTEKINRQNN